MLKNRNIAFYAPIKPPDHHIPSGDRLIAQNLVKALDICDANHHLASRYIAYSKRHASDILTTRKQNAILEAQQLVDHYQTLPQTQKPELWLTYHPYCKAPDWIGPIVSKALNIPYVTIEAARTGQGGIENLWKLWREEAQAGIKTADMHLVFKPTDREYLTQLLGSNEKLRDLPPFIDAENMGLADPMPLPQQWHASCPVLITTGMMRKGKKKDNFEILSDALSKVKQKFNLIVVGGGPEEVEIQKHFSWLSKERVLWTGAIDHSDVLKWMRASDVFIWPGWKEPIGMVYLEAQLQELPIIAYKSMGVPLVVKHDHSGLLAEEGNASALAANLETLLRDATLRNAMGKNGRQTVLANHGIKSAASQLNRLLSELLS